MYFRTDNILQQMATIYLGSGSAVQSKVQAFLEGKGRFAHVWEGSRISSVFGMPLCNCLKTSFGPNGSNLRKATLKGEANISGRTLKAATEKQLK
jgi:hypothetical protein